MNAARTRYPIRPLPLILILLGMAVVGCFGHRRTPAPPAGGGGPVVPPPSNTAVRAPTGYDNKTNCFTAQAQFDRDKDAFEEVEDVCEDGLGPVYNDRSCAICHQNPVTGSSGQTAEIRAGFRVRLTAGHGKNRFIFVEPGGGSLVHQRATDARIQEHVPASDPNAPGGIPVRTLRMTTNVLGDGFVEVVRDADILDYQNHQPSGMKGLAIAVPVAVSADGANGEPLLVQRIGRLGWKCQEASLLNFSAGAYLNEMGITSLLNGEENRSNGNDVSAFDPVADPEDDSDTSHPFGVDVEAFRDFMRATKAPPQAVPDGTSEDDVRKGEALFGTDPHNDGFFGTPRGRRGIGCALCHRPSFTTPPAGEPILLLNTSQPASDLPGSKVPAALGDKIIFPYSDLMLHDIGTGDGITQTHHAQNPPRGFQNMLRFGAQGGPRGAAKSGLVDIRQYNIVQVERQRGGGAASMRRDGREVTGPGRRLVDQGESEPGDSTRSGAADQGLDQRTMRMIRTAPLWGLRVRPQLLHDGSALTVDEAIRRHRGQAEDVKKAYLALSARERRQLVAFLDTLGYGPRPACEGEPDGG